MSASSLTLQAARLARAASGLRPPPWAEHAGAENHPAREILPVLRANKVSLIALAADAAGRECPEWRTFAASAEVEAAIEEERRRKAALADAYAPVAKALGDAGISHVLFKSSRGFPHLSSNLDLLVAPRDFREAARLIEAAGHIRMSHYREDHKLLFRTFESGAPALSVHLHEAVSWGKLLIIPGDGVVQRSLAGEDAGIRVASPQDSLTATLLHSVIETDQVRLSDLINAKSCLARGAGIERLLADAERGRFLPAAAAALLVYDAAARRTGFGSLLSREELATAGWTLMSSPWAHSVTGRALRRARPDLPFKLPSFFAKILLIGLILGDGEREAGRQIGDLVWSGWNLLANRAGLRCRPASLITISGPDGSGKSAVAETLMEALRTCEVPVRSVWTRGGFSTLARVGKALARRAAPRRFPAVSDETAKRIFLGSRRLRWIWAWWISVEQTIAVQRVRLYLALGKTVVSDRYIYDSLADFIARVPRSVWSSIPRRASSLLLGAARVPDLAIFLDVSPETAFARKPDGATADSRKNLVAAYGEVSGLTRFRRVDANVPLEKVRQAAVDVAVRECVGRFRGARL